MKGDMTYFVDTRFTPSLPVEGKEEELIILASPIIHAYVHNTSLSIKFPW